ncbi:hypothetical protein FQA39_LY17999 [Lamprigera yunnana]|nr:hypothetical protein FQA39_LY17999 [Lamprigera yunnana]
MDINYNESNLLKLEVIKEETFTSGEVYEDYENLELKSEPVDFKKEEVVRPDEELFINHKKYEFVQDSEMQQYICNKCNFNTVEKNILIEHLKVHKDNQYECKECGFATMQKRTLKVHSKIHKGEEYACIECNFKTIWRSSMNLHSEMHKDVQYFCSDCDFKTTQKRILEVHCKIHEEEQYACNQCDFKTSWKSSLKSHLEVHEGIQYLCNQCDFKTMQKRVLQWHLKLHEDNQYSCKECDFVTQWKQTLKLWDGETLFEIEVSDEDYNRAQNDMNFAQRLLNNIKGANKVNESSNSKDCETQNPEIDHDDIRSPDEIHNGKWSYNETLALITTMENYLNEINHSNPKKKKDAWSSISSELESLNITFTIMCVRGIKKELDHLFICYMNNYCLKYLQFRLHILGKLGTLSISIAVNLHDHIGAMYQFNLSTAMELIISPISASQLSVATFA